MSLLKLPAPSRGPTRPGVFWNPNSDFIAELAADLQNLKVLEIFAGNGLLAGYLAREGVQLTATSMFSSHDASNHGKHLYHPVIDCCALTAIELYADHDVLLMSWPTVTEEAFIAAMSFGKPVYFIGERTDYSCNMLGGTATDNFWAHANIQKKYSSYRPRGRAEGAFKIAMRATPNPAFKAAEKAWLSNY